MSSIANSFLKTISFKHSKFFIFREGMFPRVKKKEQNKATERPLI